MGRFSFKPPKISIPTVKPPSITIPDLPSIPSITPPDIPIPNVPTPGGSFEDIPGGISLLTENIGYGVGGVAEYGSNALHKLAKFGKEAWHGKGGYADDAGPDAPGLGPTGDETPDATLLTGSRKREVAMGRSFHSGSGTASTVSGR